VRPVLSSHLAPLNTSLRIEPSGMTNDPTSELPIVDHIFRWMGKKFLSTDQQEEIGILSPEVRARLAQSYAALEGKPTEAVTRSKPPRQDRRRSSITGKTHSSVRGAAGARRGRTRATRAATAGLTPAVAM